MKTAQPHLMTLHPLDRVFSTFRPDSELRGLHAAAGSPVPVSGVLADLLETATRWRRLTGGPPTARLLPPYQLTVVQMGPAGFLNELHRGNDAGAGWGWLIDVAGVFLTLLGLTGIGLLLYLKKFRPSGLVVMAGGPARFSYSSW